MPNVMEILQEKLQEEVQGLQDAQKQQTKILTAKQTLDAQLSENKGVKEELDILEPDAKVFKLVGPALIRQDVVEAVSNVEKRISYISGEIKRQDETLKDLEKKQNDYKENLQNLQIQMQKMAQVK